jgi:hypothetical protein
MSSKYASTHLSHGDHLNAALRHLRSHSLATHLGCIGLQAGAAGCIGLQAGAARMCHMVCRVVCRIVA